MIKYSKVFYQRGTNIINVSIPVQIFINDKTQIVYSLNPPYRHVLCLNIAKKNWHWFVFHME